MNNYSKNVIVPHSYGIHARVAAKIVEITKKYNSEVFIIKNGKKANAKSIVEILMLAISKGENITVTADGDDCIGVVEDIVNFIKGSFNNYL